MTRKYVVFGQFPSLNQHLGVTNHNRFGGAKMKKEYTIMAAKQFLGKPKITHPCSIAFTWHCSTRSDPDNIRFAAKYILDGMVEVGVLPNDSIDWIKGFDGDHFVKVKKGFEMVELIVQEEDDDEQDGTESKAVPTRSAPLPVLREAPLV